MNAISRLCLVAVLLGAAGQAHAILFNFAWTGDPAQDAAIVSSTDSTLRASGTIDINAAPGSIFTLADIVSTNILVSGDSIDDFIVSSWIEAGGMITANGAAAIFSAAGNPFSKDNNDALRFFGCRHPGCDFFFVLDITREPNTINPLQQVFYDSQASALASMRMTAVAIPEPTSMALVLFGLAGLIRSPRKRE